MRPSPTSRVLRGEDAFLSLWLVALGPFAGELFLDGGVGSWVLALAAVSFVLALVLRDRDVERPVGLKPLLASVGVTGILLVAATKQLGHRWLELPLTIALVVLMAIVWAQERFRIPAPIVRLPAAARRALALPFLAMLAELFAKLTELFVPNGEGRFVGAEAASFGEAAFYVGFGLAFLTMLYAMFVALPRTVIDPHAPRDLRAWAGRFGLALASAAFGVWVTSPLLDALFG
jgi:hypothetical protein